MTITSELFEAYLKCPTKCFLLSLGEAGEGNEYTGWICAQSTSYQRVGIGRLKEQFASGVVVGPLDARDLKSAKWGLATESKVCARDLETTLHALERIPPDPSGQAARLVPIRFISANKLGLHDKLILAFDALVLSLRVTIQGGRNLQMSAVHHRPGLRMGSRADAASGLLTPACSTPSRCYSAAGTIASGRMAGKLDARIRMGVPVWVENNFQGP
jgi:hypothetical protein